MSFSDIQLSAADSAGSLNILWREFRLTGVCRLSVKCTIHIHQKAQNTALYQQYVVHMTQPDRSVIFSSL